MIFDFIGKLLQPLADTIDELHTSDEEKGEIEVKKMEMKAKLAEIENKVATRMMELQQAAMEANAKIAISEQQSGNWLSKSHRPLTSLTMVGIILSMGFGWMQYDELIIKIAGSFLGIYGIGRTYEKSKK